MYCRQVQYENKGSVKAEAIKLFLELYAEYNFEYDFHKTSRKVEDNAIIIHPTI